ncbi:MAG: sulfotransferase [Thermoleophilia bacterium]|nr:sulfotransferase [Thermoleophilia bacterium]
MKPAPGRGPIFLVGAMGSGTTLLRLILDSHDRIAIPQETGFMRAYDAHQFIPFKWSGRNWAKRLGWSRAELDDELRAFYERIFRRYAERSGKPRWGDKTPLHTWHVGEMARLFPDSVFVGVVRHPGAAVGSNLRRELSQSTDEAITHYRRYTREVIRQAARRRRRFVLLRFEDLVLHPEPVLRELLDWLGEPWCPAVLEHHAIQRARGGKLRVEGGSRADDPIDPDRVTRWRRTLDGRTISRIERRLGRLSEFLGYSFADPAALAQLRPGGGYVVGGRAVNRRIDAFGDLDLRTAGPVPPADGFLHPGRVQPREVRDGDVPLAVKVWRRVPEPLRRATR